MPTRRRRTGIEIQTYCAINPTDLASGTSLAIDIPQELIDRLLGRTTDFSI